MTRRRCGEPHLCLLCWVTVYLPRFIAEPLVRWKRYRKPRWVAEHATLYRQYVEKGVL